MNSSKISPEVKVGLLVFIAIIGLFYMSFKIGKFGMFRGHGYELKVTFSNTNGLDPRSGVQIAGVVVGKVTRIDLEGYKAVATLFIKENVKIPDDSTVSVKTQGMLGDKYLEIIPGSHQTYLADGGRITNVIAQPDMNEIFARVDVAAKNFGETVGEFQGIIGEKEKVELKKSIENMQVASGDFKELVSANKNDVTRIVKNMQAISDDIEKGKGTLGKFVKDDTLYNDTRDTVSALKSISNEIEEGRGTLGKLVRDDTLYNDVKDAAGNIKELTEGVKKGEGSLGKLAKDDSLYNETEKAMKKLQKGAEGLQEMTPITILGTIFGTFF
ncbi:MAG TPA: MlaD family protein [Syntrophorhabdaceae bacterium]|nr:MlaD family protein [Syntrophorhabdaceae bacterium]